ncbi:hypothetical protein CCR75_007361 [Bremia lactucae]|uniref:Uncharacterized protein n=1 Tax=Bremia lactucae TaxID=4779 RepID=A0A976FGC8_BRELC|nr:hypothetical protein CCR75_007361 [Bremia lactucae]
MQLRLPFVVVGSEMSRRDQEDCLIKLKAKLWEWGFENNDLSKIERDKGFMAAAMDAIMHYLSRDELLALPKETALSIFSASPIVAAFARGQARNIGECDEKEIEVEDEEDGIQWGTK